MSEKGTIPINPELHNFENCLTAVSKCDLFLGIISPFYGRGIVEKDSHSITHLELLRSIELKKPRFMLCHKSVVIARTILNSLSYNGVSLKGTKGREKLRLLSKSYISDLKTIDMYESAVQDNTPVRERMNHWVQEYEEGFEVLDFVKANFDPKGHNRDYLEKVTKQKHIRNRGDAND